MKRILTVTALILLIVSCGKDVSNRSLKDYFSSFLNENETIVAFGSAELNTLLEKVDYKSEPKVNAFIGDMLNQLSGAVDMNTPVYYAIEGPLVNDNPTATYVFLDVKNADSLRAHLTKNGFDLNKTGDIDFCQDGDMNIGIENNLAIMIIKGGDYKREEMMAAAFEKTKGDLSTGNQQDILSKKGDIVMGMNLAALYHTSNTDLNELSEDKQKELKAMLQDSYIENSVRFENGAIVMETKNHFSQALNAELFFKSDNSAPIIAKLGQGSPRMGISINLDMKKMQAFMDEYSPETLETLSEDIGGPFTFAMMAAGNDLSQLFNGQFGIVMVGDPNAVVEGMTPAVNFHIGLGQKGQAIGELMSGFMGENLAKVELTSNGISGYSDIEFVPASGASLQLPQGCEDFGKSAISGFVNLEGVDMSSFMLEGEAKLLELVKYVTFSYDQNGGKLIIKAKDGKENMLKQAMNKFIKEAESSMSGIAI